mmetsp:Transcript_3809/g.11913  ORF Transcript_3809/g.11913 Transcript_3809/m.11913 type:complete len:269 (-) Transcript_3809:1625-2431(-)
MPAMIPSLAVSFTTTLAVILATSFLFAARMPSMAASRPTLTLVPAAFSIVLPTVEKLSLADFAALLTTLASLPTPQHTIATASETAFSISHAVHEKIPVAIPTIPSTRSETPSEIKPSPTEVKAPAVKKIAAAPAMICPRPMRKAPSAAKLNLGRCLTSKTTLKPAPCQSLMSSVGGGPSASSKRSAMDMLTAMLFSPASLISSSLLIFFSMFSVSVDNTSRRFVSCSSAGDFVSSAPFSTSSFAGSASLGSDAHDRLAESVTEKCIS